MGVSAASVVFGGGSWWLGKGVAVAEADAEVRREMVQGRIICGASVCLLLVGALLIALAFVGTIEVARVAAAGTLS